MKERKEFIILQRKISFLMLLKIYLCPDVQPSDRRRAPICKPLEIFMRPGTVGLVVAPFKIMTQKLC